MRVGMTDRTGLRVPARKTLTIGHLLIGRPDTIVTRLTIDTRMWDLQTEAARRVQVARHLCDRVFPTAIVGFMAERTAGRWLASPHRRDGREVIVSMWTVMAGNTSPSLLRWMTETLQDAVGTIFRVTVLTTRICMRAMQGE